MRLILKGSLVLLFSTQALAERARLCVAADRADHMLVMHLSDEMLTAVAISPAALRDQASYRRSVTRDKAPALFNGLSKALAETHLTTEIKFVDIRWGCELSRGGRTIGSFYLGGHHFRGEPELYGAVINGRMVMINAVLWRWFETQFREAETR